MAPCQNTRPRGSHGMRRVCALYIYMVWSYFSEVMRWVCAGHLYQDMARKVGSALAAPNLRKRVCARKAPAEDFGICARHAQDSSLAGLSTTTLNDLTTIHPFAKHIYLGIARKIGSRLIPPSVRKRGDARKVPAEDFGVCARYAPG